MVIWSMFQAYLQFAVLIFAIYFSATTMAVYAYMFWTGRLIRLQRALFLVAIFTVISVVTYSVLNKWVYRPELFGSAFALPITLAVQHVVAVILWLIVLVISVLFGSKDSF